MGTLTETAVRLRVIATSLLAILGFVCLGMVIGFWLGFRNSPSSKGLGTTNSASLPSAVTAPPQEYAVPNQK